MKTSIFRSRPEDPSAISDRLYVPQNLEPENITMSKRFIDLGSSKLVCADSITVVVPSSGGQTNIFLRGGQMIATKYGVGQLTAAMKEAGGSLATLGGRDGYTCDPNPTPSQQAHRRLVLLKFPGLYETDSRYISLDSIDSVERAGENTILQLCNGRSERVSSRMLSDLIECIQSAYGTIVITDKTSMRLSAA